MTHHTIARRRGRPPGLTVNRIMKRFIIIEAILAGIKIVTVARHLGVSRSWASREANAPGTRNLLAELLELSVHQSSISSSRTSVQMRPSTDISEHLRWACG